MAARHHYHQITDIPDISPEAFRQPGVTIIRATTGAGKTERVLKPFCEAVAGHGAVGIVAPLVAITHDIAERAKATHYADIATAEAALGHDRVVTTCQSLDASRLADMFRGTMDYWCFDEATQSFEGLASCKATTGGISTVGDYEAVRAAIKSSKHLVLLDAGMNDAAIQWIEGIRRTHETGERFRIYDQASVKRDLLAKYTTSSEALALVTARVIATMMDGGRPIIAVESKDDAATIEAVINQSLPNARTLLITSETRNKPNVAAFLGKASGESLKWDCVIHSPTLTSGVSIQHEKPHFTHGFVLGGGFAVTPARVFQMMRRVRYLKEWQVFFKPNNSGVDITEATTTAQLGAIADETGEGVLPWNVFKKATHDRQESARSDFALGLLAILEDAGFTTVRMTATTDAESKECVAETKAGIQEAHVLALLTADDINDAMAESIRRDRNAIEADRYALEAFTIRRALRVQGPLCEADIAMYDGGRGVSRLNRLNDALGLGVCYDTDAALFPRSLRRKLYSRLFGEIDVTKPIGDRAANLIVDRAMAMRVVLSAVGITGPSFGRIMHRKDGTVIEAKRPERPNRFVGELLERMGLDKRTRKQNRHATETSDATTFAVADECLSMVLGYAAQVRGDGHSSGILLGSGLIL